jgi:hypothetical protein
VVSTRPTDPALRSLGAVSKHPLLDVPHLYRVDAARMQIALGDGTVTLDLKLARCLSG